MITQRLILTLIVSAAWLPGTVLADSFDYPPPMWDSMSENMPMHDMRYPPRNRRFLPPPPGPDFSDFPTVEELARMTPPEPVTEETIKSRFSQRKEQLKKFMEQDRKAAVKYAQDFSKYQKQQADNLVKLMAMAEKRRTAILKQLEEQEQIVLERFRQQQAELQQSTEAPAEMGEPTPEKPSSEQ